MKRLVLIDGHAILHRAYHALPPLMTTKGEQVNAVFGFVSILLRVIHDLKPTHLVVAFDTPSPTFRNKIFKDYQAQRPKMDKELIPQIGIVHRVVEDLGIPIFELDGYEADDVLGSLAKQASISNNLDVVIVTGDRDILQLVNEKVKVYMPVKGLSESKLYGEKEVEEKYRIASRQIVDYKALAGDQSDNYPGVAGVGPKTASVLLTRFQTLEEIYQHIDTIENEHLRKKLQESEESAELAKKLATIVTDVPVVFDPEKCTLLDFDRPNVRKLFEELEFRSLIPRLSGSNKQAIESKKQKAKSEKQTVEKDNVQQIKLF